MIIRTTITLPTDLYEQLRLEAYRRKTSVSGVIQQKLTGDVRTGKKVTRLMKLAGTYRLKGKGFDRKAFYDKVALRDMALGH